MTICRVSIWFFIMNVIIIFLHFKSFYNNNFVKTAKIYYFFYHVVLCDVMEKIFIFANINNINCELWKNR